jgi:hypothetical protein
VSRLIWIELERPDEARQLVKMLEVNGVDADTSQTIRGKPEVHVHKPRFRRMSPFMVDVESVVRRWLEEQAAEMQSVTARTVDESFEIRSPVPPGLGARTGNASSA